MKKNVVFIGTRSWYKHIVPAVMSLLDHTEVDMIYLVIEDDEFPYELPCNYTVINASGQEFFLPGSVNYKNYFSYLCLLRVAFAKILPEDVDQVLSLDDDIIVVDDISPMWDVDLEGKWMAAVPETWKWGVDTECYYNCGVVMYNLKQMRKDGIADKLIDYLNSVEVTFSDQVAINYYLITNQDKAVKYPVRYNEFCNSGYTDNPAIVHYCGYHDWMTNNNMPRVGYLKEYQKRFQESDIMGKWEKKMAESHKECQYMIHACPQRMWYVENFMIPRMIEQGIHREEILIWNDEYQWGNLKSFTESMRYVMQYFSPNASIWHLQDDVLISDRFAEYTQEHKDLAYGFCNDIFDPDNRDDVGVVLMKKCWHSFQCICIPNALAAEFYQWYDYLVNNTFKLKPWVKNNQNDDMIFRLFLHDKHEKETCVNVSPNLVDHIDYLMGGTTLHGRRPPHVAYHWSDTDVLRQLTLDIAKYHKIKPYNGKKYVCYTASHADFPSLNKSLESLVKYNPKLTEIFLLVDKKYPFSAPKNCTVIDIFDQTVFPQNYINANADPTFTRSVRVCLGEFLPEYVDKVLLLDSHCQVWDDLSPLWSVDLTDKWFAGVDEANGNYMPYGGNRFINGDVIMHNLYQQKIDGADKRMITYLVNNRVHRLDSEALNKYAIPENKDVMLIPRYNDSDTCGHTNDPAIKANAISGYWTEAVINIGS